MDFGQRGVARIRRADSLRSRSEANPPPWTRLSTRKAISRAGDMDLEELVEQQGFEGRDAAEDGVVGDQAGTPACTAVAACRASGVFSRCAARILAAIWACQEIRRIHCRCGDETAKSP